MSDVIGIIAILVWFLFWANITLGLVLCMIVCHKSRIPGEALGCFTGLLLAVLTIPAICSGKIARVWCRVVERKMARHFAKRLRAADPARHVPFYKARF